MSSRTHELIQNRCPRFAATLVISFTIFLTCSAVVRAQQSAIDTYAITNARIVTVSGPIVEQGTIVVRNGLINAVGTNVSAPQDARVIDGTGLTIYPGLIDANTTLGMPAPSSSSSSASRAGTITASLAAPPPATPFSPNSSQPVGLQPEILAADILRPGGDVLEAARAAGVTAALTAPRDGIFIGQSALINLAGITPQQMIVRSPVALHIGFTPLRSGTYPASLMGVIASIRQMLLDAGRYREANAIYARNPRGLRRPEQDKSLAALLPVLAREMPVVMYADREREIMRALDLAQEFNLRLIIAGGAEAWKLTDRLRALKVSVLLSLNFPRRTTPRSPEADVDPLRILRERVDAPKTAGRLASAGVRFAFQSGQITAMTDFLTNAARTVENGLQRDEALRALTIYPAELFGVADRLGTIEPGKIANLTITRGDLFDRNRRVAYIFIDGRPVDLKAVTTATAGGAASIASGTWSLRVSMGDPREASVTLTLQQEGERLSGSIQGDLGSASIANASIGQGGDVRFTAPVNIGGLSTEATFDGTITGNEMRGTVQVVGRAPGSFTATRPGSGSAPAPNSVRPPSDASGVRQ